MKFPLPTIQVPALTPDYAVGFCIAISLSGEAYTSKTRKLITYRNERWLIHRLCFHLNVQPIPVRPDNRMEGLILHHCDNGWCINHAHLYNGTSKQNAKDKVERNPDAWKALLGNEHMKGKKHSASSILKMKKSQKGNVSAKGSVRSKELRAKISCSVKNRWTQISHPMIGRKHTAKTKSKISATMRNRNK
jgi:hypothetical protein